MLEEFDNVKSMKKTKKKKKKKNLASRNNELEMDGVEI